MLIKCMNDNTLNICKAMKSSLMTTQNESEEIERCTRHQRKNPFWFTYRVGRLTGSVISYFVKKANSGSNNISETFLVKLTSGTGTQLQTNAIVYGIMHEPVALRYLSMKKKICIKECGLIVDSSGILAASPDGLVGENACVEVKCTWKYAKLGSEMALKDKSYGLLRKDNGEIIMTKDSIWYDQVQMQMYVSRRTKCYFILYITDDSIIIEIPYDKNWSANVPKLINFYWTVVFPKIVSKRSS